MTTVAEIQAAAAIIADATLQEVSDQIASLQVLSLDVGSTEPVIPDESLALIDLNSGLSSVYSYTNTSQSQRVSYSGTTTPVAPTLSSVATPSALNVPSFDDAAPTLNLPTVPTATLPSAPGNAPEFSSPVIADRPAITLPSVPTFSAVSIPSAPAIDIPYFTATAPIDDLIEPSNTFSFVELDYSSELLDAVKEKVSSDLENGGYGIETADELAIWERQRERELSAADAAIDDIANQIAARGFVLPPGALFAAQQQAEQRALDAAANVSREIAVKRADLFLQARQFAITHGTQIETVLMNYSGAKAERALNAAKAQIEVGISLYNVKVTKFRALLDAFQAQAQVFETKIRAQLAALETFKAQLEGARISVEVQQSQVRVYLAQIEAANATINLYRTDMEASRIRADIERLKLEGFKTTVEAYTAQVGAREAEYRIYEAQIKGEVAKIDVYRAAAQAYSAKVDGVKTKVQADEVILRAQIAGNQLLLDKYKADIDGYRAIIERINDENRIIVAADGLSLELEKVLDHKEENRKQTVTDIAKANAEIYAKQAQLNIQTAVHRLEGLIKLKELSLDGNEKALRALVDTTIAQLNQLTGVAVKSE